MIEYRIKLPSILIENYSKLLKETLESENPSVVSLLESGMSDRANLSDNKTNKIPTNVFKTVKNYNISELNIETKIVSFFKFPYAKIKIKDSTISSICLIKENDNIFSLPQTILEKRIVIPLDFKNPEIWNFRNSIVENILGIPEPSPIPEQGSEIFVYILSPQFIFSKMEKMDISEIIKSYIILLHRKMILKNKLLV
jgi:hypothetical protein